ncbi:MAG: hypothetical protein AVDCRST_MAG89-3866, partial [uncultured Gemmatimonadetes bacterium]
RRHHAAPVRGKRPGRRPRAAPAHANQGRGAAARGAARLRLPVGGRTGQRAQPDRGRADRVSTRRGGPARRRVRRHRDRGAGAGVRGRGGARVRPARPGARVRAAEAEGHTAGDEAGARAGGRGRVRGPALRHAGEGGPM